MRAPLSGCRAAYSARIAISAGISDSAIRISLRPQSASDRSATRKSVNLESATAAFMIDGLHKDKAPAPFPMRAPLTHVASLLSLTPLSSFANRGDATLLSERDSNRLLLLFKGS